MKVIQKPDSNHKTEEETKKHKALMKDAKEAVVAAHKNAIVCNETAMNSMSDDCKSQVSCTTKVYNTLVSCLKGTDSPVVGHMKKQVKKAIAIRRNRCQKEL